MPILTAPVKENLRFTYSDYRKLPDNGKRYEILNGELLMSPAPSAAHQTVLLNLATILKLFVENKKSGKIFIAPFDVALSKYNVVQPDILFVAENNKHIIKPSHIHGVPDLVVEIFSPNSVYRDRIIKRKIYARHQVMEYWLVHPLQKNVQVLRLKSGDFRRVAELTVNDTLTSPLFPGLEIDLATIFPDEY